MAPRPRHTASPSAKTSWTSALALVFPSSLTTVGYSFHRPLCFRDASRMRRARARRSSDGEKPPMTMVSERASAISLKGRLPVITATWPGQRKPSMRLSLEIISMARGMVFKAVRNLILEIFPS